VAYLSGIETSVSCGREAATDDAHFSAVDVDDLRQSLTGVGQFHGVDLLLTSQWPRDVDKYATAVVSHNGLWCSRVVQINDNCWTDLPVQNL